MRTATIYNFLLEANVMASIAILLMLPIRKFLRKPLGNKVLYFAWLLVAIRLLCPLVLPNPFIAEIRPTFLQDEAIRPIAGQLKIRFSDAVGSLYSAAYRGLSQGSAVTKQINHLWDSAYNGMLSIQLMKVYLIGVVLVAAWFAISNLRFRHRLRVDRIEPISGKLLEQYEALCKERGVKPLPVYFTDPLPSACLVGVFRPYIALPLTAAPQDAIHVLTHEVCHYKGHDPIWGLVRLLCCAIHWFNPLVWVAASLSRTDGELACDDRVISKMEPKQRLAYANVLVLAASKRTAPGVAVLATGMTMTGRKLKTRVNAILHNGQMKKGLALAFALLASMTLIGAFATAEYRALPPTPISVSATAVPHAIASEEDVIASAQRIWAQEGVHADTTGLTWTTVEDDEWFYVDARQEDGRGLSLALSKATGAVGSLRNDLSNFDLEVYGGTPRTDDEQWQASMAAWLKSVIAVLNPGAEVGLDVLYNNGESRYDGSWFIEYRSEDVDGFYQLFDVQYQPEVRLVFYNAFTPVDDGMGNG